MVRESRSDHMHRHGGVDDYLSRHRGGGDRDSSSIVLGSSALLRSNRFDSTLGSREFDGQRSAASHFGKRHFCPKFCLTTFLNFVRLYLVLGL